ncbi:DUF4167 domain-containing protein [Aquibium carbonis]|nr:DUF4167 domain-containing protein [Aquibium carbonis]
MRGRNNNNNNSNNSSRKGPNPLTRSYESNGPDVKIRGSAQQIAEKYSTLARDAHSAGDRVMAENYLQHAEHYNRIIMAAQGAMPAPAPRDQRDEFDDEDGDESGDQNYGNQQPESRQPEMRQNDGRQNENRDNRPQGQNEGRQNDGRQGEGRDGRQQDSRQGENRDGRQRDNRREDGRREDGRREDGRREDGRRDDNRRDGENQPRDPRREHQPQPVAARDNAGNGENQPHDGSGPQPVIEGMPAEVALEQEAMSAQKPAGRRRGRPPRSDSVAKGADDNAAAEATVVAPAAEPVAAEATASEAPAAGDDGAPRRPRRPRRPRKEGEPAAEDNSDEPAIAAQ